MIIFYHKKYNIDLGILNRLHPFDGLKFKKVYTSIRNLPGIKIHSPQESLPIEYIDEFGGEFSSYWLKRKRFILRALELPFIPILPFSLIDNRILKPMRWGVAGTLLSASKALIGENCWNMSGGYHHASHITSEGFCIYNDIGIAVLQLKKRKLLNPADKFLIIDIDAHQGNGNALTFLEDKNVCILDIYNNDIYPQSRSLKERVDINIPLISGTRGKEYLEQLKNGLNKLDEGFKLAFVVAGTDVIASDPLGGLALTVEECVERDSIVIDKLLKLKIPFVFLGGGGYSKDSATAIAASIAKHYQIC